MLSPEKGGSSSRNWTRPMGKPKMRKEGRNIWWISEQSPRVFPLIAGRMFSFMETRLSLSDTDNLSIWIFILCTGLMDVKGIFLPINFRRVAFLQNPGHPKRVMLPSAPANLILYLGDLFQRGHGRGRWKPMDLMMYICPCHLRMGTSWMSHRNSCFLVLQSCPFASGDVNPVCRLWWGRLCSSLHWKIDWKFYSTNLEQQILHLCSELLFQCPVSQLMPVEWTTPRSSLASGFNSRSQILLACGAEDICPNCSLPVWAERVALWKISLVFLFFKELRQKKDRRQQAFQASCILKDLRIVKHLSACFTGAW